MQIGPNNKPALLDGVQLPGDSFSEERVAAILEAADKHLKYESCNEAIPVSSVFPEFAAMPEMAEVLPNLLVKVNKACIYLYRSDIRERSPCGTGPTQACRINLNRGNLQIIASDALLTYDTFSRVTNVSMLADLVSLLTKEYGYTDESAEAGIMQMKAGAPTLLHTFTSSSQAKIPQILAKVEVNGECIAAHILPSRHSCNVLLLNPPKPLTTADIEQIRSQLGDRFSCCLKDQSHALVVHSDLGRIRDIGHVSESDNPNLGQAVLQLIGRGAGNHGDRLVFFVDGVSDEVVEKVDSKAKGATSFLGLSTQGQRYIVRGISPGTVFLQVGDKVLQIPGHHIVDDKASEFTPSTEALLQEASQNLTRLQRAVIRGLPVSTGGQSGQTDIEAVSKSIDAAEHVGADVQSLRTQLREILRDGGSEWLTLLKVRSSLFGSPAPR